MAKFQHVSLPSSPALPTPSPPPHHPGALLQQDLAKLVDKDPDTRRSAMAALKGYIEGELDVKSMPYFLEQVSGESNKGEASRTYAISLFVEVARVQKQMIIPYIPRIMATVTRSLLSSAGSQSLHQACANVVASVARYVIEPPSPGVSSRGEEVLRSLCQPLLGLLCNKVEPVSVGGATCLQALVESEKWKFASLDLVSELCHRAVVAVGEKGTQTVAHMNLVRSLAKFNVETLQEYGAQLLKSGVEILVAAACGSWQQRVAAAQLLSAMLRVADTETLALQLVPTTEALERCRLDKVAVVRRAVVEALDAAKSVASDMDNLHLLKGGPEDAPAPRRLSESRRRGRRKSMWRTDEGPRSRTKDETSGSSESKLVSYASSPSSSSALSASASSPSSTVTATTGNGRSPLYPAKQSPAMPPFLTGQYSAESGLEYILARLKSSESKENAPLIGKSAAAPLSMKSDDLNAILDRSRGLVEHDQNDGETTNDRDGSSYEGDQERCSLVLEEDPGALSQASNTEDDMLVLAHGNSGLKSVDSLSSISGISDMELQRSSTNGSMTLTKALEEGTDREECLDLLGEDESNGTRLSLQSDGGQDNRGRPVANVRYNSLAHVVNLEAAVSPPQVAKTTRMAAEDFLLFATPRRLVRSLQSASSTPESRFALEGDSKEELELEFETLSESGWSVRDNPIADDSEEEGFKNSVLAGLAVKQEISMSLERFSKRDSITPGCVEKITSYQAAGPSSLASQKEGNLPVATELSSFKSKLESCSQLCDSNNLGHRDTVQLSVEEPCNGILDQDHTKKLRHMECDIIRSEAALDNSIAGNSETWPRSLRVREWTVFVRTWSKAEDYIEVFLAGALCAVLMLGMAIVISISLNGNSDVHVLVPT